MIWIIAKWIYLKFKYTQSKNPQKLQKLAVNDFNGDGGEDEEDDSDNHEDDVEDDDRSAEEEVSSIACDSVRYVSTGGMGAPEGRKQWAGESRVELLQREGGGYRWVL